MINNQKLPIADEMIEEFLANKKLNLTATTDQHEAIQDADFVVISTPTNYDPEQNFLTLLRLKPLLKPYYRLMNKH